MSKRKSKGLSDTELLVMRGVWLAVERQGSLRTSELVKLINEEFNQKYTYSSIVTYIERLEARGYLKRDTVSNVALLIPLVSREEYAITIIKEECETLFQGDRIAQLHAVLKANGISVEDLARHLGNSGSSTDTDC